MTESPTAGGLTDRGLASTAAEAMPLRFLDPGQVPFMMAGATLRMVIVGEVTWLKVAVLRAFPLTDPDRYYSVRDGSGEEIGVLRSLEGLDPASRACVEKELSRRYVVSVVKRIRAVKERCGAIDWDVETTRGPCRFTTRELRENVIRAGGSHYIIMDTENNRFEVPDLAALDAQSQAWLLRQL